jgi:acyl-CoA synthetase (AMP-forming)/AMP-acid ligase II
MRLRSFTIYDIFQRNADLFATDTALVCGDRRIGFAELRARADRLAAGLAAEGVQKGDRVAILGLNCHRFFYLFGAAAALGAVVVPINWRLATDEIRGPRPAGSGPGRGRRPDRAALRLRRRGRRAARDGQSAGRARPAARGPRQ